MSDAWGPEEYSRGEEAREFAVRFEPYVHTDGSVFEYLLLITRRDGTEFLIRAPSAQRIAELVEDLAPDRIIAADSDCEEVVAVLQLRAGGKLH